MTCLSGTIALVRGLLPHHFAVIDKALLPLSVRAIERDFGVPITGHVDLNFGVIPASR